MKSLKCQIHLSIVFVILLGTALLSTFANAASAACSQHGGCVLSVAFRGLEYFVRWSQTDDHRVIDAAIFAQNQHFQPLAAFGESGVVSLKLPSTIVDHTVSKIDLLKLDQPSQRLWVLGSRSSRSLPALGQLEPSARSFETLVSRTHLKEVYVYVFDLTGKQEGETIKVKIPPTIFASRIVDVLPNENGFYVLYEGSGKRGSQIAIGHYFADGTLNQKFGLRGMSSMSGQVILRSVRESDSGAAAPRRRALANYRDFEPLHLGFSAARS